MINKKLLSLAISAIFLLQVVPFYPTTTPPIMPPAEAQTMAIAPIMTNVVINAANEVPPNNSAASGTAKITIDTAANTLAFDISYVGLSSAEMGAHIHGPAVVGVNSDVIFALPAGNPKIGVWNYLETQEADILAGRTYINIHSANFLGGEIRGQITQ